jgi:glycosyltransferase involved in cell wall biosynthesis
MSKIQLLIDSACNENSSLGRVGHYLISYFLKQPEYNTWIRPWLGSNFTKEMEPCLRQPTEGIDVILRKSDPYMSGFLHQICRKGVISFIYYDNRNIDPKVIEALNHCVKLLIVPSIFLKERFIKFGVTIPIKIAPLGVDRNVFQNFQKVKKNTFTFINYGEQSERKGSDLLLKAFVEEFGNNPNVFLKILCSSWKYVQFENFKQYKNIIFIEDKLSNEDLVKEINSAECFIALTREDSFGMCGLESMSCGLPVIAPEKSGYSQYVDTINGFLVQSEEIEHERWQYIPKIISARIQMKKAVELYETPEWSKKVLSAIRTANKLSWERLGNQLNKLIQEL